MISHYLDEIEVGAGGMIIERGSKSEDLFILIDGKALALRRHASGKEIVVCRFASGALIGELSFISGSPRSTDVRAGSKCTLKRITCRDFQRIRRLAPEFVYQLLLLVTNRLIDTTKHFAESALIDLPTRLLLYFNELRGKPVDSSKNIAMHVEIGSQADIARELGVTRESVNRAIRELEESGEIVRSGKRVIIVPRKVTKSSASLKS